MILVIAGPTGSGKSALAVSLAKKLGAAVINADAFQVYRELTIATAKPTESMRREVPHYLFDFVPLTSDYSVFQYQKDLRATIELLQKQNTPIIIAGGTGLYLRAGLMDYEFPEEKSVDLSSYESLSNAELHERLREIDPKAAESIHPNNRVRVLRAIRVFLSTGRRKSEIIESEKHALLYDDVRIYGLEAERSELYPRCDARVERMFEDGLVEEDRRLIEKYGRTPHAFRAIGVKELFPYFDGEITLEEAKETIKRSTRNYVKRQETFFRNQFEIRWVKGEEEILLDLKGE